MDWWITTGLAQGFPFSRAAVQGRQGRYGGVLLTPQVATNQVVPVFLHCLASPRETVTAGEDRDKGTGRYEYVVACGRRFRLRVSAKHHPRPQCLQGLGCTARYMHGSEALLACFAFRLWRLRARTSWKEVKTDTCIFAHAATHANRLDTKELKRDENDRG